LGLVRDGLRRLYDVPATSQRSRGPPARPSYRRPTDSPLVVTSGTAVLLVDLLDAVSQAVCDHAGLSRDASRSVLSVLWGDK